MNKTNDQPKCSRIILFTGLAAAICSSAWADEPPNALRAFIGYKQFDIGEYRFHHNTHKDDLFLPNASIPGSAGTTELSTLNYVAFGLGYELPIVENLSVNFDIGGLGGPNRDRHKNANDSRPDANAAFVFSEANWGVFVAFGINYYVKRFYVGGEGQVAGLFISSGWDRFDEDEDQRTQFKVIPSAGPKIGYRFSDTYSLEGSAQFGKSARFGITLKVSF